MFKEIADKVYATQLDIHDQEERNYFTKKSLPAVAKGNYQDLKTSLLAMDYDVMMPSNKPEWAVMDSSRAGIVLQPTYHGTDTIPDLSGLTAKDAVFMTEKIGLKPVIHGKGFVGEQSLIAGSPMIKGSEIYLNLTDTIR